MKKTLLLLLVIFPLLSQAQLDTLFMGDREPTYYYWGDWWVDYIYANTPPEYHGNLRLSGPYGYYAPEYARCFYTKDTLKVVGVAAAVKTGYINTDLPLNDSSILAEYFKIFYYHGPADSLNPILAETRYDTASPRYMSYIGSGQYRPLVEAYFDSAISVIDTFYVSVTMNNDYKTGDSVDIGVNGKPFFNYYFYHAHPWTLFYVTSHDHSIFYDYFEHSPFGTDLIKYTVKDVWNTCWQTADHWYVADFGPKWYAHVFPIFDTTSYQDTTTVTWCRPPDNLRAPAPDAESTVLMWHSFDGPVWEVSLCKGCTEPDSGVMTQYTTTFANLTGLEAGATYTAWVRALCASGDTSEWSDSLQFYVPQPADTGVVQQVFCVDDAYFRLSPNPAREVVNVFSSFQMREVAIYSLSGVLMRREEVRGVTANMDISGMPKGVYIVRATTTHGMSYARLVVE